MIYLYIALAILVSPIVLLILGWLISIIILQVSYMIRKEIPYDSIRIQIAIKVLAFMLIKSFRLKYRVINKDLVPTKDIVMFGNHISALDPVVLCYEMNHTYISGLAKKSLFKIPVFNHWVVARRVVAMDRTNDRKDAKAMLQAISQAKEGQPMFVFPEGTRSRTGEMIDFKAGSFRLATKSKKDIVVFKFTDMNRHKWYHLWRIKCTLKFFPVIKYDEYKDMTTQELSDMVKNIILKG